MEFVPYCPNKLVNLYDYHIEKEIYAPLSYCIHKKGQCIGFHSLQLWVDDVNEKITGEAFVHSFTNKIPIFTKDCKKYFFGLWFNTLKLDTILVRVENPKIVPYLKRIGMKHLGEDSSILILERGNDG